MEAAQITVDPSKILQVGTGFFGTKTLLTAVNMELFTVLAKRELSGKDIQSRLGLHSRSLYDFLDALVAMDFLKRKGLKESALYSNAEDADFFLDKNKSSYIGGILEISSFSSRTSQNEHHVAIKYYVWNSSFQQLFSGFAPSMPDKSSIESK